MGPTLEGYILHGQCAANQGFVFDKASDSMDCKQIAEDPQWLRLSTLPSIISIHFPLSFDKATMKEHTLMISMDGSKSGYVSRSLMVGVSCATDLLWQYQEEWMRHSGFLSTTSSVWFLKLAWVPNGSCCGAP
mmetsp:Transcript_20312/g.34887  ORF Transcript_20312/g.34887 Transcript_20312/m.34887 type:complete len:133 (+) Transcript_20312:1599-1997(+)